MGPADWAVSAALGRSAGLPGEVAAGTSAAGTAGGGAPFRARGGTQRRDERRRGRWRNGGFGGEEGDARGICRRQQLAEGGRGRGGHAQGRVVQAGGLDHPDHPPVTVAEHGRPAPTPQVVPDVEIDLHPPAPHRSHRAEDVVFVAQTALRDAQNADSLALPRRCAEPQQTHAQGICFESEQDQIAADRSPGCRKGHARLGAEPQRSRHRGALGAEQKLHAPALGQGFEREGVGGCDRHDLALFRGEEEGGAPEMPLVSDGKPGAGYGGLSRPRGVPGGEEGAGRGDGCHEPADGRRRPGGEDSMSRRGCHGALGNAARSRGLPRVVAADSHGTNVGET